MPEEPKKKTKMFGLKQFSQIAAHFGASFLDIKQAVNAESKLLFCVGFSSVFGLGINSTLHVVIFPL